MHVFEHAIKLIPLYGSEIWSSFNPLIAKFRYGNQLICMDKMYSNLTCEKLHSKFCKFILVGTNKNTNCAALF